MISLDFRHKPSTVVFIKSPPTITYSVTPIKYILREIENRPAVRLALCTDVMTPKHWEIEDALQFIVGERDDFDLLSEITYELD